MRYIHLFLVASFLAFFITTEVGCGERMDRRARISRFTDSPLIPIGRAERDMSGKITYRLSSLVQKTEDEVYVDIEVMNGTARGFRSASCVITFLGRDGARKRVRWNMGPLKESEHKRVNLRTDVDYKVEDIQVSLQTTM